MELEIKLLNNEKLAAHKRKAARWLALLGGIVFLFSVFVKISDIADPFIDSMNIEAYVFAIAILVLAVLTPFSAWYFFRKPSSGYLKLSEQFIYLIHGKEQVAFDINRIDWLVYRENTDFDKEYGQLIIGSGKSTNDFIIDPLFKSELEMLARLAEVWKSRGSQLTVEFLV